MSELYTIKLENNSNANLEGTFDKIDANFQALLSGDYAKGDEGVSIDLQSVYLVDQTDDTLTLYGKMFLAKIFADYSLSFTVGTAISDVITYINLYFANNSIQTYPTENFLSFMRGIAIPVTTLESCLEYDTKEPCPIASGMISFVDARNTDIANSAYKSTYKDLTTYIYFSIENDTDHTGYYLPVMEKAEGLPTIYWDSDLEQFCWEINGLKGITAQGPTGKNGVGTEIQLVAGIKNNDRIELKFKWNFSLQAWETITTATIASTEMCLCYILKSDVTVITADTEFSDFVIGFADTDGTTKYISPSYNTVKDILSTLSPLSVFANIGSESSELSNIDYLFLPGIGYAADKSSHPELNCYALTRWQDGTGCYHVTFQPKFTNDTEQGNAHFEMYFQQCSFCDLINVFKDQLLVTFGCNVNFQNYDAVNIGNLSAQTANLTGSLAASTYGRTNTLIDADSDTAMVNKGWVNKTILAAGSSFSDIYFLKSDYVKLPEVYGFTYTNPDVTGLDASYVNREQYQSKVYITPAVYGIYMGGKDRVEVMHILKYNQARLNDYLGYSNSFIHNDTCRKICNFADYDVYNGVTIGGDYSSENGTVAGPFVERPDMLLILTPTGSPFEHYRFAQGTAGHTATTITKFLLPWVAGMDYLGNQTIMGYSCQSISCSISDGASFLYAVGSPEGSYARTTPISYKSDIIAQTNYHETQFSIYATKDRWVTFDFPVAGVVESKKSDCKYSFAIGNRRDSCSGFVRGAIIPYSDEYKKIYMMNPGMQFYRKWDTYASYESYFNYSHFQNNAQ